MANGDNFIQPEPARIDVAEAVAEIYSHLPAWQRQQLTHVIRQEFRMMAAEHDARRLSQTIEAVAEISPELASKIESLPTSEQKEKGLDVLAAIVELVSALTNLYNTPPDPQTITRIVVNIEGPDVEAIIMPPSPQDPAPGG
jgi:ribosomal protein L20A (L18A)